MAILCVDPDPDALAAARDALDRAGFETRGCGSVADARAALGDGDEDGIDCLITEQDLPDGTGLGLIEHARKTVPDAACILFTGVPLSEIDTAAFGGVVAEYLAKDDLEPYAELVDLVEHGVGVRSQTAYPLPDDEAARLAALERYAASPAELDDSLDRLTRLATALFGVDSAAVGLVDEGHERFLSCHGADFGDLDRDETVCTYAILDRGVTIVEDLRADPRFDDNETLAAAGIRFYAGAPLRTPEGAAVGTFCLQHGEPRSFDERDRELLALLADEVMEQLVLRRRLRDADDRRGADKEREGTVVDGSEDGGAAIGGDGS